MKKAIFLIMASVMLGTLGASTQSFKKSELNAGYVNIISNVEMDAENKNFLGKIEKKSAGFDFRVGFVESLLEIQNKDKRNGPFFDTVAVWVSYRF